MESEKISYDDFAKIEILLGTILSVEIVPDADKLLRLEVDLGEETPRQILSGIREYFEDPQSLVGKQCPFVANLAPRMIRGLESNGMIVAANSDETFALFHPSNALPNGTRLV
jgi:methionyl-tRNA synthetase